MKKREEIHCLKSKLKMFEKLNGVIGIYALNEIVIEIINRKHY